MPNTESQNIWNGKTKGKDGKSTLLGLFRTFFSRSPGSGQVQLYKPTIMLRRDTQKWTLVHEMTHYLFAKARTREPHMSFTDELKNDLRTQQQTLRAEEQRYSKKPSTQQALRVLDQFFAFYQTNMELYRRGPLEEFTIESMLVERALNSNFTHINVNFNVRNAFFYMSNNANIVKPQLRNLQRVLRRYRSRLFENEKVMVLQRVDEFDQDIQSTLAFINQKLTKVYQGQAQPPGDILGLEEVNAHGYQGPHHFDPEIIRLQRRLIFRLSRPFFRH